LEPEVGFGESPRHALWQPSGAKIDAAQIQAGFKKLAAGMRAPCRKIWSLGGDSNWMPSRPIVRGGEHNGIAVSTTTELMSAIQAEVQAEVQAKVNLKIDAQWTSSTRGHDAHPRHAGDLPATLFFL